LLAAQKYLNKYGNWSTSCWLSKQQKYMYTYKNILCIDVGWCDLGSYKFFFVFGNFLLYLF
jgi:hypothetical protein